MTIRKLLPSAFLTLGLILSLAACDDGDDSDTTSDSNGDAGDETGGSNDETTTGDEGGVDTDCSTFCTSFVDLCLQTGGSTEFETFDACTEACAAWDQAGINCRNDQIVAGACDQAGNMGSAC